MTGHSLRQPSLISRSHRPPVITILPLKKHSSTTGELSGRYDKPGNLLWVSGFRVWCLGFVVSGFRVWGLSCGVQGLGFTCSTDMYKIRSAVSTFLLYRVCRLLVCPTRHARPRSVSILRSRKNRDRACTV
jgi:hypothetical protein